MSKQSWWKFSSCLSICASLISTFILRKLVKQKDDFAYQLNQLAIDKPLPPISVLVPARNEEVNITTCLTAILEQDYPDFEVIVIDDNSTDQTPELLNSLFRHYPHSLKTVKAFPPKADWLGKNNALWQGYQKIRSDAEWILFVDADTRLTKNVLKLTVNYARTAQLDLFSLVPSMSLKGFWPSLLTPEIVKLYTLASNNPFRPHKPGSVKEASAVGPFILVKREAYQKVGGHQTLKNVVLEDVELARTFRANGFSTLQSIGFEYVERDWYDTLPSLWQGVSKNLWLVSNKSWGVVAFLTCMQTFYGLLPFVLLVLRLSEALFKRNKSCYDKNSWLLSVAAVVLTAQAHSETYRSLNLPRHYALLYPLSVLLATLLMLDSVIRITFFRSVTWKGRKVEIKGRR